MISSELKLCQFCGVDDDDFSFDHIVKCSDINGYDSLQVTFVQLDSGEPLTVYTHKLLVCGIAKKITYGNFTLVCHPKVISPYLALCLNSGSFYRKQFATVIDIITKNNVTNDSVMNVLIKLSSAAIMLKSDAWCVSDTCLELLNQSRIMPFDKH